MIFAYISLPAKAGLALQNLFLEFAIFSTNIYAALPLKNAAEQQNICRL